VYTVAFTKYKNERSVVISSVLKLAPEQKSRIEKLIVGIFNEKTTIRYKINEKILAGIKISSEELVIDASALAQIKQLSEFYRNLRIGTVYEN
jgi:F0F1-type ATP synthase delta subunit